MTLLMIIHLSLCRFYILGGARSSWGLGWRPCNTCSCPYTSSSHTRNSPTCTSACCEPHWHWCLFTTKDMTTTLRMVETQSCLAYRWFWGLQQWRSRYCIVFWCNNRPSQDIQGGNAIQQCLRVEIGCTWWTGCPQVKWDMDSGASPQGQSCHWI